MYEGETSRAVPDIHEPTTSLSVTFSFAPPNRLNLTPSSSSMASLGSCPVEVVRGILVTLANTQLAVVCLVNKRLCSIAQPLIFASVKLVWRESKGSGKQHVRAPPIASLLSILLRQPRLAAHVAQLTIVGEESYDSPDPLSEVPVEGVPVDEFVACVEATTTASLRHQWSDELRNGQAEAFVTLLLTQVPNLVSLRLESVCAHKFQILWKMLTSALCGGQPTDLPTFHRLRKVAFRSVLSDTMARCHATKNAGDILPFFYLPALEELSINTHQPRGFAWPSGILPVCENLTSLELFGIREGALGQFLSATGRLQTLRWECWYDPSATTEGVGPTHKDLDLDQLAADLCVVRSSLQSLKMTADCARSDRCMVTTGTLRGLRNLDNLTHLEVPIIFLSGYSRESPAKLGAFLPPNLVSLVITSDLFFFDEYTWNDSSHISLVEEWVGSSRDAAPQLKKLTMAIVDQDDEEWQPENWDRLRRLLSDVGISLTIRVVGWDQDGGVEVSDYFGTTYRD